MVAELGFKVAALRLGCGKLMRVTVCACVFFDG